MWDMLWPMPFIHVNTVLGGETGIQFERALVEEMHDNNGKRKSAL